MENTERIKRCYIKRGFYYGSEYWYEDCITGEASRGYNTEEQCIDELTKAGYVIEYRNRRP